MTSNNGIMEVYVKDSSGHPRSPINGKLKGLFFSTRPSYLGESMNSPFGGTKLHFDAQRLLNPAQLNYYFTDFYCNQQPYWSTRNIHYVTIVVCRRGSDSDDFCRPRLRRLDPEKNNFLRAVNGNYYILFEHGRLFVELFFTENVDIREEHASRSFVQTTGAGRSLGGVSNNKNCAHCNIAD